MIKQTEILKERESKLITERETETERETDRRAGEQGQVGQ